MVGSVFKGSESVSTPAEPRKDYPVFWTRIFRWSPFLERFLHPKIIPRPAAEADPLWAEKERLKLWLDTT